MNFDPTAVTKAFGAHVRFVEMCELVNYVEACTDEELQAKMNEVLSTFEVLDASSDPTTKNVALVGSNALDVARDPEARQYIKVRPIVKS